MLSIQNAQNAYKKDSGELVFLGDLYGTKYDYSDMRNPKNLGPEFLASYEFTVQAVYFTTQKIRVGYTEGDRKKSFDIVAPEVISLLLEKF